MQQENEVLICGCGRPLEPCFNSNGEKIGVTHTAEDEDHHLEYFSGLRIFDPTQYN